jgi:tRNA/tmRNA/rRNA uracil-C5-methylase (TrmA/RlmC/RlmD family)
MRYTTQLEHKRTLVYRQLSEVALLKSPEVRPCLPSFYSYDYRNSAVFHVLPDGRPTYPARNPKEKIAVDECPILEPPLEDELHKAALLGVGPRREWAIRAPEPITVGNFDYYVGPKSLFPVNTLVAERLVAEVMAAMEPSPEQNNLDLYCGVGLFTLPLAVMSADVIGIEPNGDAGRDARRNVMSIRNRLFNKTPPRILGYEISPGLARPEIKAKQWHGAIIRSANAPLDSITSGQLAKLGLSRLVYVASGTETLGRDLKVLASKGFRFDYAQPLDMIPQTRHVQCVVRLGLE